MVAGDKRSVALQKWVMLLEARDLRKTKTKIYDLKTVLSIKKQYLEFRQPIVCTLSTFGYIVP